MVDIKDNFKPVIGISVNIEEVDKEPFLGEERLNLNKNYVQAIIKAGGIPILLPFVQEEREVQAQLHLIDGLLLSGGYDIQSTLYGEEPHPDLGSVYPERDQYELTLLKIAATQNKPILGICRGMQLINVAFGGTLYQDIAQASLSGQLLHFQRARSFVASHTVELTARLYQIFEQKSMMTNSFHHQAIKNLAPGFQVNARTKDGLIEGIEKEGNSFLLGVQWHPEKMIEHHPMMLKLFRALVDQAKELRKYSL